VKRDDPLSIFELARPLLRRADITFGNCESTYSVTTVKNPATRGVVRADPENVSALSDGGFDVMSFANNHHLDAGYEAFFERHADGETMLDPHPRVFLDVAGSGEAMCPYCGTRYRLEGDMTGTGVAVANCPAANMSVYALMTRKRYLIYQDGIGVDGGVSGLYVQNLREPPGTSRLGVLGPPVLIAEGIEDLQIAYNMGSGTWCNQGTPDGGTDCDVMTNPAAIQGIKFQLVSRGTDLVKRVGMYRPAVLNHAAGTPDDIDRLVLGSSVMLRNLVYVSP